MTLDELTREGLIAGLNLFELEDMTWGEVLSVIEADRERQRRQMKDLSVIAYTQAGLTAQALTGGKIPELYELFPFWTEEEVQEMKVEKIRRVMERYAANGKGR